MKRNSPQPLPTNKRTAKDFLGTYDDSVAIPNAIRAAFAALRKIGVEEWRYESEFCALAKVSTNKVGPFRAAFAEHIVEVPGRDRVPRNVWFADKAVAKKMRDALAKNTL